MTAIPTTEALTMYYDTAAAAALFSHAKNITIGAGRVLYAAETVDVSGTRHSEGWVLPGGRRTQDARAAHAAAMVIDSMTRRP